jgi:hypothetical protein
MQHTQSPESAALIRSELLRSDMEAIVDLRLYPTEESGRTTTIQRIYRPVGFFWKEKLVAESVGLASATCHELILYVGDRAIVPGESRRLVCGFTYKDSFDAFLSGKTLYIWDGRFVGEIHLVHIKNSN